MLVSIRKLLIRLILPKTEKGEWQVCVVYGEPHYQGIVCGRCDELWSAVFNATNWVEAQKCQKN